MFWYKGICCKFCKMKTNMVLKLNYLKTIILFSWERQSLKIPNYRQLKYLKFSKNNLSRHISRVPYCSYMCFLYEPVKMHQTAVPINFILRHVEFTTHSLLNLFHMYLPDTEKIFLWLLLDVQNLMKNNSNNNHMNRHNMKISVHFCMDKYFCVIKIYKQQSAWRTNKIVHRCVEFQFWKKCRTFCSLYVYYNKRLMRFLSTELMSMYLYHHCCSMYCIR